MGLSGFSGAAARTAVLKSCCVASVTERALTDNGRATRPSGATRTRRALARSRISSYFNSATDAAVSRRRTDSNPKLRLASTLRGQHRSLPPFINNL